MTLDAVAPVTPVEAQAAETSGASLPPSPLPLSPGTLGVDVPRTPDGAPAAQMSSVSPSLPPPPPLSLKTLEVDTPRAPDGMPAVLTSSVSRSLSPPPIALDDPTASDGGPVDAQMTLDTDAGRAPDDAVLQHTPAVEAPADTPVNGTPNNVPVSPQAAVTGNAPINTPGSEATQPGRPATQQGGRRRGRRRR